MRARSGLATTTVLCLAATLAAGRAHAQSPQSTASPTSALAAEEFRAGVRAAHEGRWPDARAAFERAYALSADPLILFNLAGTCARTGAMLRAAALYRQFLRDGTAAPAAAHLDVARQSLDEIERHTPRVRIALDGLAPDDRVALDDAELPRAALGATLPVDPGPHRLSVARAGQQIALQDFDAATDQTRRVVLALAVAPRPTASPAAVAVVRAPARRAPRSVPQQRSVARAGPAWWLWGTLGVLVVAGGAVAIGVGLANSSTYVGTAEPGTLGFR